MGQSHIVLDKFTGISYQNYVFGNDAYVRVTTEIDHIKGTIKTEKAKGIGNPKLEPYTHRIEEEDEH